MRRILRILSLLLLGSAAAAFAAEGVAAIFLPAPSLAKLPMLQQVADPAVGYRLMPNQKAFSLDKPVTTNKWGYRGKDWTLEKPAGTFRIAILGASLAFGHGIEDGNTYASKLEEKLNHEPPQAGLRYEVLNFGIGGYDIGHSIQVLKQDALNFSPDLVVLSFFIGDVFYIQDYAFYPEFFRIQETNFSRFRWEFHNFFRHSRLAMYLWDRLKDHLWGREPAEVSAMIRRYAIEGMEPLEGPNAEGWRFIGERLKEFGAIAKTADIPAAFVVMPTHEEISDTSAKSTYTRYLRQTCEASGINYISLFSEVRQNQKLVESFFIPYDFHFKKAGHAWVAEILKTRITPFILEQLQKARYA